MVPNLPLSFPRHSTIFVMRKGRTSHMKDICLLHFSSVFPQNEIDIQRINQNLETKLSVGLKSFFLMCTVLTASSIALLELESSTVHPSINQPNRPSPTCLELKHKQSNGNLQSKQCALRRTILTARRALIVRTSFTEEEFCVETAESWPNGWCARAAARVLLPEQMRPKQTMEFRHKILRLVTTSR